MPRCTLAPAHLRWFHENALGNAQLLILHHINEGRPGSVSGLTASTRTCLNFLQRGNG
jgi:hypothetical protein